MTARPLTLAAGTESAPDTSTRGTASSTDRPLLHRPLTEGRQHVGDVVQEDPVRSDHEHAFAGQPAAVLEQQVGRAVQPDRGLARSRGRPAR